MRSLEAARRRARDCRARLGGEQVDLLGRLEQHLKSEHRVRITAVPADFLDGGLGEVDTSEERPRLNYNEVLDADPTKKLELFAHEYGHLELHQRLTDAGAVPDPVLGSIYLGEGAPALARYNPRSREEAEANAFAVEFVCPGEELFARWTADAAATPETLAADLGVSVGLVRVQLAEGLYRFVARAEEEPATKVENPTNPAQEDAATWKNGPLLVDAGPGTGKTKTLVRRIVHLLEEYGAAPENLLVLTFSREAADELRQRVARAIDDEALISRLKIATFHEFGVEVLHDHGHLLEMPQRLTILDEDAQRGLVSSVLGRADCEAILKLKNLDYTASEATRHITFLKDRLITPSDVLASIGDADTDEPRALHSLFAAYEVEKTAKGAVDFADLILLSIRILDDDTLRAKFREKYLWVMVDEYQDVSRAVASLLQRLCGEHNPPWVVGDARQAIYRFRGAAPENVIEFRADFPGAEIMSLSENYRSSADLVAVANRLAALMPDPPLAGENDVCWRAATEPPAVAGPAVEIFEADSDRAEYEAVAKRVRRWMEEDHAAPREIAVLARRNIDVRNIALVLNRLGIPAATTGLLTPEGAGGDLAAVLALLDAPTTAVPRLVHALGRGRFPRATLNEAVARMHTTLRQGGKLQDCADVPAAEVSAEVRELDVMLAPMRFSGDAWDVLGAFLFGHSTYLRRLITAHAELEAALNLEEILTTLGLAARHRFTAPPAERRTSRLTFAARYRDNLTNAVSGTLPPRAGPDVVRVMTCHAAKGLEFPFVAVTGQTLPPRTRGYSWLPLGLRPSADDDALQADALLFVGVTRAQRAVSVSIANTKSALDGVKARPRPRLLVRWKAESRVPSREEVEGPVAKDSVSMGRIWGGDVPETVSSYSLASDCAIRTYLEEHLGLDFPSAEVQLYPKFVWGCRQVMRWIVERAHARGARITPEEAEALLREVWPEDEFAEHPHLAVYRPRAREYVRTFAEEYDPGNEPVELLPMEIEVAANAGRLLRADLVAHVRTRHGTTAVLFRPDFLAMAKKGEGINWSALKEYHRLPFVLLRVHDVGVSPKVFVGPLGKIVPYNWSTKKREEGLRDEADAARAALAAQVAGQFDHVVDDFGCDRCSCRVICPVWVGALEE